MHISHLTFINSMVPLLQELDLKCICVQRRLMWGCKSFVVRIGHDSRWQNMPITTTDPTDLILVSGGASRFVFWGRQMKTRRAERAERERNSRDELDFRCLGCTHRGLRTGMMNTEMKVLSKKVRSTEAKRSDRVISNYFSHPPLCAIQCVHTPRGKNEQFFIHSLAQLWTPLCILGTLSFQAELMYCRSKTLTAETRWTYREYIVFGVLSISGHQKYKSEPSQQQSEERWKTRKTTTAGGSSRRWKSFCFALLSCLAWWIAFFSLVIDECVHAGWCGGQQKQLKG